MRKIDIQALLAWLQRVKKIEDEELRGRLAAHIVACPRCLEKLK